MHGGGGQQQQSRRHVSPATEHAAFAATPTCPGMQVHIRNFHDNPDSTESNDCWISVDGGDWVKVYSIYVATWSWMTRQDLGHDDNRRTPSFRFERRTQHTIRISGRSTGYSIDRIHVYNSLCADASKINNHHEN